MLSTYSVKLNHLSTQGMDIGTFEKNPFTNLENIKISAVELKFLEEKEKS